eukprot:m.311453 g.311453  ORF g.311453 m.311453 type:complete len:281 (-) comp55361_c1_seq1:271-1113(-)
MYFTPALIVVLVFIFLFLFIAIGVVRAKQWFHWPTLSATHLVDSYWISPSSIGIIRGVLFIYCLFILVFSYIFAVGTSFRFYTFWNFSLLTLYFLLSSIHSLLAHRNRAVYQQVVDYHTGTPFMRFFACSTWTLFQMMATTVFLVDTVLWLILYPLATTPDELATVLNFSSYNVHGANVVFLLMELFLNKQLFNAAHSVFIVILPLAYGVFQWIYYAEGGDWVYPFMATDTSSAAGWYVSILALHLGFFCVAYFVGGIRNFFARRLVPEKIEDGTYSMMA